MQHSKFIPLVACNLLIACSLLFSVPARAQQGDDKTTEAPIAEEVTFSNGDISLAGTLLLPSGSGPFPGVVIAHGSGSSDRSNPWTSAYADALVKRKIAVLHPDKRGAGASAGNWREATFLDLAGDAVAGLNLLGARPEVDTARIGLIGFSQGGHIVPVAATQSSAVSFVVNVSGSVVPMMEQIGDELRKMAEQEGFTGDQVETILSIHAHSAQYVLTGENWETYATALAEAKQGPMGGSEVVEGFPTDPDSPTWEFLRTIGNFDPLPYWQAVRVPTLFLYGGRDENVDVYKSADIIEESLTPAGLPYSLLLFRNNGHALFRDDAMDFIARWISDAGVD